MKEGEPWSTDDALISSLSLVLAIFFFIPPLSSLIAFLHPADDQIDDPKRASFDAE